MKDKAQALQRLSAIEAEAAALRKIIDELQQKALWKPAEGEKYSTVSNWHGIQSSFNEFGVADQFAFDQGNCFPSKEIAEKAAPLMARANKIIAAALQADPDAGLRSDKRLHSVAIGGGGFMPHYRVPSDYPLIVFVHTEGQAEEMACILNAEGVK
jgi:hypothetical protein